MVLTRSQQRRLEGSSPPFGAPASATSQPAHEAPGAGLLRSYRALGALGAKGARRQSAVVATAARKRWAGMPPAAHYAVLVAGTFCMAAAVCSTALAAWERLKAEN